MNIVKNIMGAGMNAPRMATSHNTRGVWKHIDTKYGLTPLKAEAHRKLLKMQTHTEVRKVMQGIHPTHGNVWHFHAKMR